MLKISLDKVDVKILEILQEQGDISNVELSKKVGLSPSPCLARVRFLKSEGYIKSYVGLVDPIKVGLKLNIFIHVTLEKQVKSILNSFEEAISNRSEVMECYLMTGESDYLLRVVVPDLNDLEHFIMNFLSKLDGVGNIKSSFALKQVKYKTNLPIQSDNLKSL